MSKAFVFSLDRMRGYKTQVLNTEKNTLYNLQIIRNNIEKKIQELREFREGKNRVFLAKATISPAELQSHNFYMENTAKQLEELNIELKKAEEEVQKQREIVISASQEVSGLDKLEEKQLEEYRHEVNKENETEINEQITSKLVRKDSDAAAT